MHKKKRPAPTDYGIGWNSFFDVIEITKPKYCLFCGVEASNNVYYFDEASKGKNYESTGIHHSIAMASTYARTATVKSSNGIMTKLVFMKHTSSYLPWKRWSEFILQEMEDYTALLAKRNTS